MKKLLIAALFLLSGCGASITETSDVSDPLIITVSCQDDCDQAIVQEAIDYWNLTHEYDPLVLVTDPEAEVRINTMTLEKMEVEFGISGRGLALVYEIFENCQIFVIPQLDDPEVYMHEIGHCLGENHPSMAERGF